MSKLDASVAGALVGSAAPSSTHEAREWLAHAEHHRVHVLLAERWLPLAGSDPILGPIRDTLRMMLREAVVGDALRDAECRRVYVALSRQRIRAAVIKGAALAHTTSLRTALAPAIRH